MRKAPAATPQTLKLRLTETELEFLAELLIARRAKAFASDIKQAKSYDKILEKLQREPLVPS